MWFEGEVEVLCEQLGSFEGRMEMLSGAVMAGEAKAQRDAAAHKAEIDMLIASADRLQV